MRVQPLVTVFAAVLLVPGSWALAFGGGDGATVTLHSRDSKPGLAWPVTFGVPFPEGRLDSAERLELLSPEGEAVPAQINETAKWFDGSVRWVLVDAQLHLPAEPTATYRVRIRPEAAAGPAPAERVAVSEDDDALRVDTGVLSFAIPRGEFRPLADVRVRSAAGEWVPVFPDGEAADLYLEDHEGTVFRASRWGEPEIEVEKAGPMRASVRVEGWMVSEGGEKLGRRIVRVYAFAGSRSLRLYDTFVNTGDTNKVQFRDIHLELPFRENRYRFHGAGMEAPADVEGGDYLLQFRHNRFETGRGGERDGRAPGRATVSSGDTAYTVSRRHFWQMLPSEIQVSENRLAMHLWPRHGKEPEFLGEAMIGEPHNAENITHLAWVHEGRLLDFRIPEELREYQGYRRDDAENVIRNAFLRANAMAIARTLEYWVDFHGAGQDPVPAAEAFEANPVAVADPAWLASSQAFWNISPRSGHYAEFEDALEDTLQFLPAMYERIGDYGLWNYGAYHQNYLPTLTGAHIHRNWKGIHHGGPRWPWLTFARTGKPEHFDFAEIHARHNMDVSVANWEDREYNARYDEDEEAARRSTWWGHNTAHKYLGGLNRYKGFVHWYGGQRMWHNVVVDFGLWYYYMFGYRRGWDVAMNMGQFLLRAAGDPYEIDVYGVSDIRSGMGRGAAAITLYRATHDERFLKLARRQMERFRELADEEEHHGIRHIYYAPFVERYWEVTRDETLIPYIVNWATARLNYPNYYGGRRTLPNYDGRADSAAWYGRDPHYNLMALGYKFTGDKAFLEHGLGQARVLLDNRGAGTDPVLDNVIISGYGGNPGYAAQQWGHFVCALDDHYERTGERLLMPPTPDGYPFAIHFQSFRSRRHPETRQRYLELVFHTRKGPGEAVEIEFPLNARCPTGVIGESGLEVEVTGPEGEVLESAVLPVENHRLHYRFSAAADDPAGDYRIRFYFPGPVRRNALLGAVWPFPGEYSRLVVERPIEFNRGARHVFFQPRPAGNAEASIVLRTREGSERLMQSYFVYDPSGEKVLGITERGSIGPLEEPFAAPADWTDAPWLLAQGSIGGGEGLWLEGDVAPVFSFSREEFFVPEFPDGEPELFPGGWRR